MCTVVTRHQPGRPLQILALRDEFAGRAFDDPAEWWPDRPGLIGGRDRTAGGTWCASDIATGSTALLVNRVDRMTGTPSRGVLPLAALEHGADWTAAVDHTQMASFNLVLARPDRITVWIWDAVELRHADLAPGVHMITSRGPDADDDKTAVFKPRFDTGDWLAVVGSCEPSAAIGSLVVRAEMDQGVYATVFGQLITAEPGALRISQSRTPWRADTYDETDFRAR